MTFSQDNQDQTEYVYVITRSDLSFPQQAVQACHAAMEASVAFYDPQVKEHPHLALCAVKNEQQLLNAARMLDSNGVKFSAWREPDLKHQLTAIATEPLSGNNRQIMRRYQLLKAK